MRRDERNNRLGDGDYVSVDRLEVAFYLARRWERLVVFGSVRVVNYCFTEDAVTEEGVVVCDPDAPPALWIDGCTFNRCTPAGVVETIGGIIAEQGAGLAEF